MRTLSARILLGFAALTVTFGVITVMVVVNMRQVEDQVVLIGKGYVRLALATKDLVLRQDDLRNYLEERLQGESNAHVARVALRRMRTKRDNTVKTTREIVDTVEQLIEVDPKTFRVTRPRIEALEQATSSVGELYELVLRTPPIGDASTWDDAQKAAFEALVKLRTQELKTMRAASDLSEHLEDFVFQGTDRLEKNEHALRIYTIYGGLAAMLLGLGITIWVVITLRPLRRLRDGARRIAAGDYASRIPVTGPSEVADLAREFNSMGRAVEERERELVRSERLAAIGKMAARITHEVRNPLSSISLNTELLEEELAKSPEADEARGLCRSIHREIDRLTELTEGYLGEVRERKPKLVHESINTLVGALASFVREDLASKQVELVTELADDDPIGILDAGQIRQCLINLVRNATDAVAPKGRGTVTMRTRRDGAHVVIEVQDDGVGIAEDMLPRLFEPFFSTKERGNGLGLALTQQIVRDHGGDLDVTSTVGQGTTFTVRVPAYIPGR